MIGQLRDAARLAYHRAAMVADDRTIQLVLDEDGIMVAGRFASPLVGYRTNILVAWEQLDQSVIAPLALAIDMVGGRLDQAASATPLITVPARPIVPASTPQRLDPVVGAVACLAVLVTGLVTFGVWS